MSRWLRFVFAVVLAAAPVFAQTPDPAKIQEITQKVNEAIQAKRWGDGVKLLEELLVVQPEVPGTAYNLACLESLQGHVDQGLDWLGKGADWGWGAGYGTIMGNSARMSHADMCKNDADLENLRKDPRFEAVLARITANFTKYETRMKAGEAYAAEPAIYVPEAIKGLAEKPLLVVVHDNGSTKEDVVSGFWKQVADELGFALVAPSAKIPVGATPKEQGMLWYEQLGEYVGSKDAWKIEKPIHDAVKAFKKNDKLDPKRVVLVGDGAAGTLLAFGAGLSSAGLYKAVLGLDGAFEAKLVKEKGPAAAKMGQHAALIVDPTLLHDDKAMAERVQGALTKTLADAKLGALKTWAGEKEDVKVRVKLVADTVKELLAAPPPAPADPGAAPAPT
ncbi:MAG: hypothetical protein HZA53_03460 [Planctomycetes bacterium]|nr:hypothetical protein [Planctomycetota bacterium]